MAFSKPAHEEVFELSGKLGLTEIGQGLMHSVLEVRNKADEGRMIKESISQGVGGFVPDSFYEQFVNNYSYAEKLYGKTFINLVSGFDADYVGKNIRIPEFKRELKKKIAEKIERMRDDGLLDKHGNVTTKGMQLAALVSYVEEIERLETQGLLGDHHNREKAHYGEKSETHSYRKGDRYRDIAIKRSVKKAVRRGHLALELSDLEAHARESKGSLNIVYAIDASGSMKGQKIEMAKKAGIALAFRAIESKDKVGLIVFSKEIKEAIAPTLDFGLLLRTITTVRAALETDFVAMIDKAIALFPYDHSTKHLLILSDALPTSGNAPEEETITACGVARGNGITISLIGINLDAKGEKLARRITQIGEGRFYVVRNVNELDRLVLEDYYSISS